MLLYLRHLLETARRGEVSSSSWGWGLVHQDSEGRDEKVLCIEIGNEVVAHLHNTSCFSCLSVAVIKYHDQWQLKAETVYLGLWFRRKSPYCGETWKRVARVES